MKSSTGKCPNKNGFAWRAGLTALALLAFYQAAIWMEWIAPADGNTLITDNLIRAEFFAHRRTDPAWVVSGSSMAATLKPEFFHETFDNLAMVGGCSQTGLTICERAAGRKPSTILVEMNETITRGVDEKIVGDVYQEPFFRLRRALPMFRESYKPSSVLVTALKRWKLSQISEEMRNEATRIDPNFRQQAIARLLDSETKALAPRDIVSIRNAAERMRPQLERLKESGTRVILFEIPTEPVIDAAPRQREIRDLLRREFPSPRFAWLPTSQSSKWQTSDGVHLTRSHAKAFAVYVQSHVEMRL